MIHGLLQSVHCVDPTIVIGRCNEKHCTRNGDNRIRFTGNYVRQHDVHARHSRNSVSRIGTAGVHDPEVANAKLTDILQRNASPPGSLTHLYARCTRKNGRVSTRTLSVVMHNDEVPYSEYKDSPLRLLSSLSFRPSPLVHSSTRTNILYLARSLISGTTVQACARLKKQFKLITRLI